MKIKPMTTVNRLVVHCSATRASADIGVADIRLWHKRQGWRDVGYHYVIRRNGTVEKGRPDNEPGAHASGFNGDSIGICMVGGVGENGKGEDNFTAAQYAALFTTLTRLKKAWPNAEVLGHRDLSPDRNKDGKVTKNEYMKECPSFSARDWWASRTTRA